MITSHPIIDRAQWLAMRKRDVGASETGALFGVHPHITMAALYADKSGLLPPDEGTSATARGIKLEPLVAQQIQEMHPDWQIEKATDYVRDTVYNIGATPDYIVTKPDGWHGPLDIKTVEETKFKKLWQQEDGTLVPEPFILLQVVQQIYLTHGDGGMVGVMPISGWGSFPAYVIDVPQSPQVVEQIKERANAFWTRVMRHEPPEFDFERDHDAIKVLYAAGGGEAIDLRGDNSIRELLADREILKTRIKEAEGNLDQLEAEIRAKIGNAENAIVNGWDVTLKVHTRKAYSVKETTYRTLRAKRLHADRTVE